MAPLTLSKYGVWPMEEHADCWVRRHVLLEWNIRIIPPLSCPGLEIASPRDQRWKKSLVWRNTRGSIKKMTFELQPEEFPLGQGIWVGWTDHHTSRRTGSRWGEWLLKCFTTSEKVGPLWEKGLAAENNSGWVCWNRTCNAQTLSNLWSQHKTNIMIWKKWLWTFHY